MEKLFLTGVSGFLGKHILERWDKDTYLYSRGQDLDCLKSYNPEYIIHAAAEIYKSEEMFESNIKLTYDLLETSRRLNNLKAFIYIGSSSEYGRKTKPMKETDVLEPETIYEATKGACTLLSQAYASTYGLPIMIARPFSLYGEHEPEQRLIPTAIKNVKAGWKMKISPGRHDFIHVDDFIDGLFMLLEKPQPGEIFNFGTGYQVSNDEVVEHIENIVGRKVKREPVGKMRSYDSNNWVCDYSKAKRIGWEPKISLRKGLRDLI